MIPYGRQQISEEDIACVCETLRSDYLTQGSKPPLFEQAICEVTGASFSVCVNSATSALHLACLSLEVGSKDEVWVSPISFVASSNCALYCGASVKFIDIDPITNNICPIKLEKNLKEYKLTNKPLPKVIIAVHLAGLSCDMQAIGHLSKVYGFRVIEDASHAIGACYLEKAVGCCDFSDITIFSFHPVKIITTGEGGAAVTNDKSIAEKMRLLRSHGVTRDENQLIENHGPWYYEQQLLGFNYRLTDIQASLGLSQLNKLKSFIMQRRNIAKFYFEELALLPIELPKKEAIDQSSWHLFIIKLNLSEIKKSHLQIFNELRDAGVSVNLHYMPIYLQPYYQTLGYNNQYCENADNYYRRAISIPIYHGMNKEDQQTVVATLKRVLL